MVAAAPPLPNNPPPLGAVLVAAVVPNVNPLVADVVDVVEDPNKPVLPVAGLAPKLNEGVGCVEDCVVFPNNEPVVPAAAVVEPKENPVGAAVVVVAPPVPKLNAGAAELLVVVATLPNKEVLFVVELPNIVVINEGCAIMFH